MIQSQILTSPTLTHANFNQYDESPYISVKYRTALTPASSPLSLPNQYQFLTAQSSSTSQRSRSNSQSSTTSYTPVNRPAYPTNSVTSPILSIHPSSLPTNNDLRATIAESPDDCDEVLLTTNTRWTADDSRKPVSKRRKRISLSPGWTVNCPSFHSSTAIADIRAWFKELSSDTREKLMFILSSMLGTCLFLLLFEAMLTMTAYDLEDSKASVAIVTCYVLAYLISILWQSAFYRILVYSSEAFCVQLMNTYISYSISLTCVTVIGYIAIHVLNLSPRFVALALMPANAAINFYLLRLCSASNNTGDNDNAADDGSDSSYSSLYPHANPFQLASAALSSSSPRSKSLII